MKRKIIILTYMCLMIGLSACAIKKDTKVETEVIETDNKEDRDFDTEKDDSVIKVTTSFFSVSVPKSWENDYVYVIRSYEQGSYSLSFHDKVSYAYEGGWLFSIDVMPLNDNYKDNPSYEELGSITTGDGKEYNLIVTSPTDVQSNEDTYKSYHEKKQLTEEILKSLQMENGCVFSENVKEITEMGDEESDIVVNTEYYSFKMPKLWASEGFYEIICGGDETYCIDFYNSESYNRGEGGGLFFIGIYEENEDTDFPSYKDLGKIKLSDGTIYKVIAIYPTDVQYSSETASSYRNMEEQVSSVIDTVVINEEYEYNE